MMQKVWFAVIKQKKNNVYSSGSAEERTDVVSSANWVARHNQLEAVPQTSRE